MDTEIRNFIGGEWRVTTSGGLGEQRNPADLRKVTSRFQLSNRLDAAAAIDAAQAAFEAWSSMPIPKRAELMHRVLDLAITQRDALAHLLTIENGKTLKESFNEVDATIREIDWQIAEGRRLYGTIVPTASEATLAYITRRPLGVVSVIAPWNFPLSVLGRKCTPALMAGNTVVVKPSSLTPAMGASFVRLFEEAGVPSGVINLVTGDGATVGDELVTHPKVRAISFTGSTPAGKSIHQKAASGLARTQLEMGGKNPAVVLDDADLLAAVDGTVEAAFANAGQWCTSTSRVIVDESVYARFCELVRERVSAIRVGNGLDSGSDMGPVCGQQQLENVLTYIDVGLNEGATLLAGGRRLEDAPRAVGCFVEATLFSDVEPGMRIAREEIFGPVLSIIRVQSLEEAISVANSVTYGLSSSVYTRSLEKAMTFVERSEVGLTHVNLPTAWKEPQLEFGGVKESGVGGPEAGRNGLEFFTEHRVVYVRYQ